MIQDNARLTMDNWQNSLVIKIESNGIGYLCFNDRNILKQSIFTYSKIPKIEIKYFWFIINKLN